jgi:uncharacterized protein (DUF1330 family)
MAKGYWILQATVHDMDTYKKYIAADRISFEKYGARYVVRGGEHTIVEGKSRPRQVVIEFDSYEKALECYHSPEYQAAAKFRHASSEADIVIVRGVD